MGSSGFYSSASGFSSLQIPSASILSPAIWNLVWSSLCLPKVNFFNWLLMHRRVLTGENLSSHGFHGPYRCYLYQVSIDTSDHLFIDCEFSKKVWEMVLSGLLISAPSQISVIDFFPSWKEKIPWHEWKIDTSVKFVD